MTLCIYSIFYISSFFLRFEYTLIPFIPFIDGKCERDASMRGGWLASSGINDGCDEVEGAEARRARSCATVGKMRQKALDRSAWRVKGTTRPDEARRPFIRLFASVATIMQSRSRCRTIRWRSSTFVPRHLDSTIGMVSLTRVSFAALLYGKRLSMSTMSERSPPGCIARKKQYITQSGLDDFPYP